MTPGIKALRWPAVLAAWPLILAALWLDDQRHNVLSVVVGAPAAGLALVALIGSLTPRHDDLTNEMARWDR